MKILTFSVTICFIWLVHNCECKRQFCRSEMPGQYRCFRGVKVFGDKQKKMPLTALTDCAVKCFTMEDCKLFTSRDATGEMNTNLYQQLRILVNPPRNNVFLLLDSYCRLFYGNAYLAKEVASKKPIVGAAPYHRHA